MSPAWHHSFADAVALDPEHRKQLLGGKGAALVRMTAMDLPVPPGFVLTTEACKRVEADGWFPELDSALEDGIAELQAATGRVLGAGPMPLLVSIRSGAPVSMPGMMDTVLNAGMTDEVAEALGEATGDPWFGWDTARRFVQSYATIVSGVPEDLVRRVSADCLGPTEGRHLDSDTLAAATRRMRSVLAEEGYEIPDDPGAQIKAAVAAVFASWGSERARTYRRIEGIDGSLGTAATIQMMTFGNLGDRSGTGVAFTRDPSTGAPGLVGDFLVRAQGEDVVAGTHSTLPVAELRSLWPEVADQLDSAASLLEAELADMADIEFTVEDGTLWMLQVRRGKRSPVAALRIAIDLADDPAFEMTRAQALDSVAEILQDPPRMTNPEAADDPDHVVLATGLAASPGRVVGRLCTGIDEAIAAGARGESVILVRRETSPADIAGMAEAAGLVTSLGGLVSHAAVVARSWGVPAVVGAADITVARRRDLGARPAGSAPARWSRWTVTAVSCCWATTPPRRWRWTRSASCGVGNATATRMPRMWVLRAVQGQMRQGRGRQARGRQDRGRQSRPRRTPAPVCWPSRGRPERRRWPRSSAAPSTTWWRCCRSSSLPGRPRSFRATGCDSCPRPPSRWIRATWRTRSAWPR